MSDVSGRGARRRRLAGERRRPGQVEPGQVESSQVEPGPESPADAVATHPTEADTPAERVSETGAAPAADEGPVVDEAVPAAESPAARPAARGGGVRRLLGLPLAVAIAFALLVAICIVLWFKNTDKAAAEAARDPATRAAKIAAATVLSYNYQQIDQQFAAAEKLLTPAYRKDYANFTKSVIIPAATQNKAQVQAQVSVASVVSSSAHRVVVLMFVDQLSSNAKRTAPRIDQNRVRMTMVKSGGKWLVSRIDAL